MHRSHAQRPFLYLPLRRSPQLIAVAGCIATLLIAPNVSAGVLKNAEAILSQPGLRKGIAIVVGRDDGSYALAVHKAGIPVVNVLTPDSRARSKVRGRIEAAGVYGPVSAGRIDVHGQLPCADNTVDLLVILDSWNKAGLGEVSRVMAPYGTAWLRGCGDARSANAHLAGAVDTVLGGEKWVRWSKPYPQTMDDWRQYRHDAAGTFVSKDQNLGPVRGVRWIDGDLFDRQWSPVNQIFSAAGRTFYVMNPWQGDRSPTYAIQARNAFNGLKLWTRPIIVLQNSRSPVTCDTRYVYTHLRSGGPVVALDAATGDSVRAYAATGDMLVHHDSLVLRTAADAWTVFDPATGTRVRSFVGNWIDWTDSAISISVKLRRATGVAQPPILISGDRVFLRGGAVSDTGDSIICMDWATGRRLWSRVNLEQGELQTCGRGLLLTRGEDDIKGNCNLHAYDSATGTHLWTYRTLPKKGGHLATFFFGDTLWVYDKVVWNRTTGRCVPGDGPDSVKNVGYVGLDPSTGKRIATDTGVFKELGRCGPDAASSEGILGVDMSVYNLRADKTMSGSIARGDCGIGYLNANGLRYTGGNQCSCQPYVRGMTAVHSAGVPAYDAMRASGGVWFEKGAAFGKIDPAKAMDPADWPMYRRDANRSAASAAPAPVLKKVVWRTAGGTRASAPVIAGDAVYVALIDQHQLVSLDRSTGTRRWAFTAGGRIDSPPTVIGDALLLGSADGWVSCLRARDGALVWRLRAAPTDQQIAVRGQLESIWPVNGSVLVDKGVAYVSAGRHGDADGGIALYAINPADGTVKWHEQISAFPPLRTDLHLLDINNRNDREVNSVSNEILISDGTTLFLSTLGINLATRQMSATPPGAAIVGNVGGMLYDNALPTTGMSVRFHWYLQGTAWAKAWRRSSSHLDINGNVLAIGKDLVFGVRMSEYLNQYTKGDSNRVAEVFAARSSGSVEQTVDGRKQRLPDYVWSTRLDKGNIRMRGIAAAGDRLFVTVQPGGALLGLENTRAGEIMIFKTADGSLADRVILGEQPAFDGLALCGDAAVVTMQDGSVVSVK